MTEVKRLGNLNGFQELSESEAIEIHGGMGILGLIVLGVGVYYLCSFIDGAVDGIRGK
ncbi:MAG: hypothetical protein JW969_03335 [Spirochaetales bacterium]|nr:hypothetical protein [Spirochaetales bacterium]